MTKDKDSIMSIAVAAPLDTRDSFAESESISDEPWNAWEDLQQAMDAIPPLWSLPDYVAVNPFLGFVQDKFLNAHVQLSQVRPTQLLMDRDYFHSLVIHGKLSKRDLRAAVGRCQMEYPHLYAGNESNDFWEWLTAESSAATPRLFQTVAEGRDRQEGSEWQSHISTDISRYCSSFHDEGQAIWKSPFREGSLYDAWRSGAAVSWRMEMLGLGNFRQFVANLPPEPAHAVQVLLNRLGVPRSARGKFLQCQLFSIAGWASYVKCKDSQEGSQNLVGLLAVRLAYDVALAQATQSLPGLALWPEGETDGLASGSTATFDELARYAFQVAAEQAYQRRLMQSLASSSAPTTLSGRKTLQIVFCIDVRSEVFRRHLEAQSPAIETFGFAGFFGLPFEYRPPGQSSGRAQCPVLLKPNFAVTDHSADLAELRRRQRDQEKDWKILQTVPSSAFSLVESLGMGYLFRLAADSLGLGASSSSATGEPQLLAAPARHESEHGNSDLPVDRKIDLAAGILRNLGLVKDFAEIVILCGHGSEVKNNPYRAALDCGACGGHSGEPNARAGAALLNDRKVRAGLLERGIEIPQDTCFLAALHVTTTDEIRILDDHSLPASHHAQREKIRGWLSAASQAARCERSKRLPGANADSIAHRARDWSEVRPEWGLAGNAAFIVAPRARTLERNLEGRTFLHSYDHKLDPDHKVLELIMTAPMVVANWINLQYYASTVDNRSFGSGNKLIHDVVGRIGIYQGNGGDLMTGLPWQSIHDGENYQHDPLRLLVVIEAPRGAIDFVLHKHDSVKMLIANGWLSVAALEEDQFFDLMPSGAWRAVDAIGEGT